MDPICIVGAGPAGLSAAVALKRLDLPFRILDAGARPGGIWDVDRPDTPMYRTAHFISSKTLSGFPDFPMPEAYPDYPRHDLIFRYILDYARHHGLEDRIDFGVRVTRARPVGSASGDSAAPEPGWEVEWEGGHGRFSALILATGANWLPNLPDIPGSFEGEMYHSFHYTSPEEFRGKRVLVVGGGNSGVDIACDAAAAADRAFISLRRGYHFVPKYVFGKPADVFAHQGPPLPAWLEKRVFGFLINRILVGDLTRYGLPKPDHPILSSHPIMNTEVLHHLGHGTLEARPDVERFQGKEVVFSDGTTEEVDLVLLATGYRRDFPFLDLRRPGEKRPPGERIPPEELFLNLIHRGHPTLFLMGLFETDGAAYDLFGQQAELAARCIRTLVGDGGAGPATQAAGPGPSTGAARLLEILASERPDLTGGRHYVDSPRHRYYVTDVAYRKALRRFRKRMGWH